MLFTIKCIKGCSPIMIKLIFTKALLGASHHAKVFTHVSTTCSYCSLWNKHVSCFTSTLSFTYYTLEVSKLKSGTKSFWNQARSPLMLDMAKDLYFLSASCVLFPDTETS